MVSVLPQLNELKGAALDLLFPRFCVGCGKEGNFICAACQASLPRIEMPVCPKCGKPQTDSLCSVCVNWASDIDAIRSPFRFEGLIRKAVHEFKYRNLRAIAGQLGLLLADYLKEKPDSLRYNCAGSAAPEKDSETAVLIKSALLAFELSKLTGISVNNTSLIRSVYNVQQAKTANVEERRKNVIGIFKVVDVDLREKKGIIN